MNTKTKVNILKEDMESNRHEIQFRVTIFRSPMGHNNSTWIVKINPGHRYKKWLQEKWKGFNHRISSYEFEL